LFGGSGSGKFFTRLTAIFAALFMITSLSLTIMSAHRAKGTVMQGYAPPPVSAPAPKAEPAKTPPAAS
jgi:preprotein translocase subunit SecG